MRRENLAAEILAKLSTPLKSIGPEGPPRIVEVPENVTVGQSAPVLFYCKISKFLWYRLSYRTSEYLPFLNVSNF